MKRILSFTGCLMASLVVFMAGCADKKGGPTTTIIPPTVTLTAPARAAVGVPVNRSITATFSNGMAAETITTATFKLRAFNSNADIPGVVTFDAASKIATFDPTGDLIPNTPYLATISSGVKDLAGTEMEEDYFWSFETALTADTTAPTVIYTGAQNGETGLSINRASTATFSEAMNSATLATPATNFTVKEFQTGNTVSGNVTYIGNTAVFKPTNILIPNTKYTSTITIGAQDLAGIALAGNTPAGYVWSWTTASAADVGVVDLVAPLLTNANPAHLAIDVAIDRSINATFNEPMDPTTMITTNFTVTEKLNINNKVTGNVSYDVQQNIATFLPEIALQPDTSYIVTVTSGAKDLAGNSLVVPAVDSLSKPNPWEFKTAATPIVPVPPQALAINLRGAAPFGIASRAGLTSTGVTKINGDVALALPSPTCTDSTGNAGASQTCLEMTYASPTGMTVNGSIYWAGDPFDNGGTANSVTNDLNIAWVEGKNKVDTNGAIPADELDGKIFTPGVYHNATLGLKAGGVATIDAQNDANAIFIFKVDSSFVDSGTLLLPSRIVLINGAQARNIWFVAGLDITIGSGTTWNGNILAGRTATVNNGSTLMGRVLAGASGAGAVTLTGAASPSVTTITVPE